MNGGLVLPGAINKFITTGVRSVYEAFPSVLPASLDIAPGIGWAKEKLLLLCFRGKARKKLTKSDDHRDRCLLEDLNGYPGVFANILLYLFIPFPHEIECQGSIFAPTRPPSKRALGLEAPTVDDESNKKTRSIL